MSEKDKPPVKKNASNLASAYIISVLSAWNSEYVTYPFDLIKTRLQLQGEIANQREQQLANAPKRNFLSTTIGIVKEEGVTKLWSGLSAVMCRHLIYSGTRLVVYKFMRESVFKVEGSKLPMKISAVCGVTGGIVAQFLANPADLVKTLIQMEGKRKLMGLKPRVHGLFDAFRTIIHESSFRGLWKGAVPNMMRAAMVNLGDLTGYDVTKKFLLSNTNMSDALPTHIVSSLVAGFTAAVLGTPSDTLKTRVMNQPVDENGRPALYKNTLDCLAKTIKHEGIFALYKGFTPMWVRLGPWALIFWISYEQYANLVGAAQF